MKKTNEITIGACPLGGKHCASCMYYRGWWNTRSLHEGDPTFCCHPSFSEEAGAKQEAHAKRARKRTVSDGWHTICGYDVMVKDGSITYGMDTDRNGSPITVYIYRASRYGGYNREYHITPAAFRAGLSRGTIIVR